MKNKKLLYVLIPGVIFIWGVILYRIIGSAEGPVIIDLNSRSLVDTSPGNVADTFAILNNYRDPFNVLEERPLSSPKQPFDKKKVVLVQVSVSWPQVVYNGLIRNQHSKKELAIIQVNGEEKFMRAGEKIHDVELLKIFKDSILVSFGKNKKMIRK